MTKPSFFQKLTGVDESETELEIEKSPKEELLFDDPKEVDKETGQSAAENNTVAKNRKTRKTPAREGTEEWLPESEGQLTIDVYQTPSDIVIKSTIAGVSADDLDIAISNDMVTIRGARKKDEEVKTEDYYYQECYWGAFSRSVILPVDIEADKADASLKNGILTIRLPKVEKAKTRKLKVKAS
ncbi:MAG: Hsp20/alpha crystallin family protein [Candidatus Portnoybacteria bacterium]|nr:Hsp20/alpha crystallin family protein [Candidatus Portnoybacteria bacterium]